MANCAYKDKERTKLIYADEATDKDAIYYCPNKECTAHMQLCSLDGERKRYFSAKKSNHKHIENCIYYKSNINFNRNDYDEDQFDFEEAIKSMLNMEKQEKSDRTDSKNDNKTSEGSNKKLPIHTILQIYSMCKELKHTEMYANHLVSSMLLDDRSVDCYIDRYEGIFLIEAKPKSYLYHKTLPEIYLSAPINNKEYSIVLNFDDEKLYKDLRSDLFDNIENVVILSGIWHRDVDDNTYKTKITTKKQIRILNKKKKHKKKQ